MKNSKFQSEDIFKSQGYARNGLKLIFKNERNFRIGIVMAVIVIITGFLLKISYTDWIAISLVISTVLISEAVNSAIEALCDTITQKYNVNIKYAKDVTAGAVLISVLLSVIIGIIVFTPYILKLISL